MTSRYLSMPISIIWLDEYSDFRNKKDPYESGKGFYKDFDQGKRKFKLVILFKYSVKKSPNLYHGLFRVFGANVTGLFSRLLQIEK